MEPISTFARRERKYQMSFSAAEGLLDEISGHIAPDEYPQGTNLSVYYDTPTFLLARRGLEKPLYREKLRLRTYDPAPGPDSPAFVELKKKYDGVVYKRRIALPLSDGAAFLAGEEGPLSSKSQIGRELARAVAFYGPLSPALFIGYHRRSFRGVEDRSFRLTLDDDISWSQCSAAAGRGASPTLSERENGAGAAALFSPCPDGALLPAGQVLMEVKTAGAMPLWLARALSQARIYPTSFSKYNGAYGQYMARGGKGSVRCA